MGQRIPILTEMETGEGIFRKRKDPLLILGAGEKMSVFGVQPVQQGVQLV